MSFNVLFRAQRETSFQPNVECVLTEPLPEIAMPYESKCLNVFWRLHHDNVYQARVPPS